MKRIIPISRASEPCQSAFLLADLESKVPSRPTGTSIPTQLSALAPFHKSGAKDG